MYAYCGNDPVNHTDPEGLFWGAIGKFFKKAWKVIKIVIAVTAAIVAIAVAIYITAGAFGVVFAGSGFAATAGGIGAATGIIGAITAIAGAGASIINAVGAVNQFIKTTDGKQKGPGIKERIIDVVKSLLRKPLVLWKCGGAGASVVSAALACGEGGLKNPESYKTFLKQ